MKGRGEGTRLPRRSVASTASVRRALDIAMQAYDAQQQALITKIRRLPPERVAEVEDFVDFIRLRDEDGRLSEAAARLSEPSLAAVWDNAEDDVYNEP